MINIKIGSKVRIVNNGSGHNYMMGKTYTVVNMMANHRTVQLQDENGWTGTNAYNEDVKLIINKENIRLLIKEHEDDQRTYEDKINFMTDYGIDEFDDKTFKAYQIIKKYKNSKSEKDMIEEITKII